MSSQTRPEIEMPMYKKSITPSRSKVRRDSCLTLHHGSSNVCFGRIATERANCPIDRFWLQAEVLRCRFYVRSWMNSGRRDVRFRPRPQSRGECFSAPTSRIVACYGTVIDQPLANLGRQIGTGIKQPVPRPAVMAALLFRACQGWSAVRHRVIRCDRR